MNLNLDSVKSNTALELVLGLESGDLDRLFERMLFCDTLADVVPRVLRSTSPGRNVCTIALAMSHLS